MLLSVQMSVFVGKFYSLELYCNYGHSYVCSGKKQLLTLCFSSCDPSVSKLTFSLQFHITASFCVWYTANTGQASIRHSEWLTSLTTYNKNVMDGGWRNGYYYMSFSSFKNDEGENMFFFNSSLTKLQHNNNEKRWGDWRLWDERNCTKDVSELHHSTLFYCCKCQNVLAKKLIDGLSFLWNLLPIRKIHINSRTFKHIGLCSADEGHFESPAWSTEGRPGLSHSPAV